MGILPVPSSSHVLYHVMRSRADFVRVQKSPLRYSRPQFVCSALLASDASSAPLPMVGFTITKKCGNAVVRNRIRRRLREALRAELQANPMKQPLQMVFLARDKLVDMPFVELRADIARTLSWLQHKAKDHAAPSA